MLTSLESMYIICLSYFNLWRPNVLIDLGCYTAWLDRPKAVPLN
jgi:hypothetical protein